MKKIFTLSVLVLIAAFAFAQNQNVVAFNANVVKRSLTHSAVKLAAPAKTPKVIEDQPQGESVTYVRTGGQGFLYDYDEESVSVVNTSGTIEVVYGADNKVYLKNPIYDNEFDTWIEGTVINDGAKLSFPTGQYIVYDDDYGYGIQVYAGKLNSAGTNFVKAQKDNFTYTVNKEQGTLTLDDFTDVQNVLAVFYSDDNTWAAGGEWLSTFEKTMSVSTELLTPPTGLQTETWYVNGKEEDEESNLIPLTEYQVQVGFKDNEVYVKGISVDLADAWIKGTVNGNTVTFDMNQYIGELYGYDIFFVGYNYTDEKMSAPQFTLSADKDAMTTVDGVVINADPYKLYYWQWMDELTITKQSASAVKNIENADVKATKAVKNNRVVIIKNGAEYTTSGQLVK